jgi:hypothetical protein
MNDDNYYIESGCYVFTEKYLKNIGYCCNNGCRHCPYKKNNMIIYENVSISELISIKQELNDLIEKKRFDIEKRIEYENKLECIQKLIIKKIDNLKFD